MPIEEVVTEIGTRDEHPFPIPKRLAEWIHHLTKLIREPPDPMNVEKEPTFSAALQEEEAAWEKPMQDSIMWLRAIAHDLNQLTHDFEAPQATHVRVISLALDRELMRLEALFEWAKNTWKYDPAVLAAAGLQPDPEAEEPQPPRKLNSCK